MNEIEERLRALEEKNAALEKRLAEVSGGAVKSDRDLAVERVDQVFADMVNGVLGATEKLRGAFETIPDESVYPMLSETIRRVEHLVANSGPLPEFVSHRAADYLKMLRTVAELAREHGITFRELNLPRP